MIRSAIIKTYITLGPGLFESAYQAVLKYESIKSGLIFLTEVGVPVIEDDVISDVGYRIDLLDENKVIIEIKSLEALAPVHH